MLSGNLQFLSITHNKLNFIPSPALWPLHQIITLHLDDNNITRLGIIIIIIIIINIIIIFYLLLDLNLTLSKALESI